MQVVSGGIEEEAVWDQIWTNLWAKGLQRSAKKKLGKMGTGLHSTFCSFSLPPPTSASPLNYEAFVGLEQDEKFVPFITTVSGGRTRGYVG